MVARSTICSIVPLSVALTLRSTPEAGGETSPEMFAQSPPGRKVRKETRAYGTE